MTSMTVRRNVRRLSVAVLAGALALSGTALAEGKGKRERMSPEEKAARIEAGVHERLAPRLGLDAQGADRLATVLKRAAVERRAAMKQVRAERRALKELLERKAPAAELEAQMAKLTAARKAVPGREAVLEETRGFLTVEQQAQLSLMFPKAGHHGKHRKGGKDGKHRRHGRNGAAPEAAPTK